MKEPTPSAIRLDDNNQIAYLSVGKGQEAIIDADDIMRVAGLSWDRNSVTGYVRTKRHVAVRPGFYPSKTTTLHRLLANATTGDIVDHINGDILDNRKSNLRFCTPSQSAMNRGCRADNQTKCKGVDYHKKRGEYRAQIQHGGKRVFLGWFDNKEEAAAAYDSASLKYHGEFGRRNGCAQTM